MKINKSSTVSLTTFRLRKEYEKELTESKIPSFVQERIEYEPATGVPTRFLPEIL